jgi:hypothetical protein
MEWAILTLANGVTIQMNGVVPPMEPWLIVNTPIRQSRFQLVRW